MDVLLVFLLDHGIQQIIAAFPEVYMPLHLMMAVDSTEKNKIVGTSLAADDTHDSTTMMIKGF